MAPGFRAVHPIEATSPQECSEITAHVFRSFRFETTHTVPRYRDWLRAEWTIGRPTASTGFSFSTSSTPTAGRGAGC